MPCLEPLHFSQIAGYIYDFCPLFDPGVASSVLVCDVKIFLSIFLCAVARLFSACLVNVQGTAPSVKAGCVQEWNTCLFR